MRIPRQWLCWGRKHPLTHEEAPRTPAAPTHLLLHHGEALQGQRHKRQIKETALPSDLQRACLDPAPGSAAGTRTQSSGSEHGWDRKATEGRSQGTSGVLTPVPWLTDIYVHLPCSALT